MSTIVRALLPLCVVALVASAAAAQSKPKSSSTLITEDEIEHARPNVGNAFDIVQLLRPRWLGRRRRMGSEGLRSSCSSQPTSTTAVPDRSTRSSTCGAARWSRFGDHHSARLSAWRAAAAVKPSGSGPNRFATG